MPVPGSHPPLKAGLKGFLLKTGNDCGAGGNANRAESVGKDRFLSFQFLPDRFEMRAVPWKLQAFPEKQDRRQSGYRGRPSAHPRFFQETGIPPTGHNVNSPAPGIPAAVRSVWQSGAAFRSLFPARKVSECPGIFSLEVARETVAIGPKDISAASRICFVQRKTST